ncbi:RNA-directed DNA polymerase [uncultured Treponema sp.]|uniref:RNA-directed DNA polymerase n=1 Tax=uncultured Treponema sp. TaxID=162155 RepID=UPI003430CDE0
MRWQLEQQRQHIHYAFKKAGICKYFLKLDVRKYFDSIQHKKLKELLFRIIKDRKCLALLFGIIDSYSVSDGRGLPIGNLTSQFFANYYLSSLDHFVLEKLKPKGYARYMDDIVVFSDSKSALKDILFEMQKFIEPFSLLFKQPVISSCRGGVPFLGYSVSGREISLLGRTRRRKARKVRRLAYEFRQGLIDGEKFADRISCMGIAVI